MSKYVVHIRSAFDSNILNGINLRIVCQNSGISFNRRGYDYFNLDYFVSMLMWMFHKVIAEQKLI